MARLPACSERERRVDAAWALGARQSARGTGGATRGRCHAFLPVSLCVLCQAYRSPSSALSHSVTAVGGGLYLSENAGLGNGYTDRRLRNAKSWEKTKSPQRGKGRKAQSELIN